MKIRIPVLLQIIDDPFVVYLYMRKQLLEGPVLEIRYICIHIYLTDNQIRIGCKSIQIMYPSKLYCT